MQVTFLYVYQKSPILIHFAFANLGKDVHRYIEELLIKIIFHRGSPSHLCIIKGQY